jgi:UDP-N-acetylmuramate: L-alanyl-gamma-D-glutamyl-meso-diaminopimelate ligase
MKVHFIAIGGSVMHNLAIALHKKGYQVSGSDDQIFDPARNRLEKYHLLPPANGWHPERVHKNLDGVILGMHAREDNPELKKARKLKLKIWSFPEYLYEQTKNKKRVVIGGSHGKTTITSMVMHVLKEAGIRFDYMVGARIEGFDTMVGLDAQSTLAIFEGDEYLSSPIDPRPKFHLYRPHIAVISGIAWDHINVFPTFNEYLEQFYQFTHKIAPGGTLIYYRPDHHTAEVACKARNDIQTIAYQQHPFLPGEEALLTGNYGKVPFRLIGAHNAANVQAALEVCRKLGIKENVFYQAISSFKGAARRLEKLCENEQTIVFQDFAHAPSKLQATIEAVKSRYPERKLVACMELHTFSSLNKTFIPQYKHTMQKADLPIVYFNPETIRHKKLEMLTRDDIRSAFDSPGLQVYQDSSQLQNELINLSTTNTNVLLMTSGNFDGINLTVLASKITGRQGK